MFCYTKDMNYYEETLNKIEDLMNKNEYDQAKRLILNELDLPYVPKEFEVQLHELLSQIRSREPAISRLSEEEIEHFLFMDEKHQLIAVNELHHRNLRDFIELCQKYFDSNGFRNGKVLLIDSLIQQQISHKFRFRDNEEMITFDPSDLESVTDSKTFHTCISYLEDIYMKEPSKLKLAEELLYKEMMLHLPEAYDLNECDQLCKKIVAFIENAFR